MAFNTREFQERFNRGLERALERLAAAILDEAATIISNEAIDEGTLLASSENRRTGPLARTVAWTAAHAGPVEFGSKPHWPPFEPILKWVRRNLSVSTNPAGERVFEFKRRGAGRRVTNKEALERVARAVQAKIAKDGTKPVRYARRAVAAIGPRMEGIVARELGKVFRDDSPDKV